MPPELFYYLVWYVPSRLGLCVVLHFLLRANAEKGIRGLGESNYILIGFFPIFAEVGLGILTLAAVLSFALNLALKQIADFYLSRYGGRRE